MAYTQEQLEAKIAALETTLARGELRVDYAERSVTYRSTQEVTESLRYFKQLHAHLVGAPRSKQTVAVAVRGL